MISLHCSATKFVFPQTSTEVRVDLQGLLHVHNIQSRDCFESQGDGGHGQGL